MEKQHALALVIGNAKYQLDKDKLLNAVNDADDFAKKLVSLGFTVIKKTDCDRATFDAAVQEFGAELPKYNVGLFYFSGHGLQIEGKNYLTSIDTSFVDALSVKYTAITLDEVMDRMHAANPIVKVLVLDACRNNPLPNVLRSIQVEGLAPIRAPKGTIIAFSTSPGETAQDYGAGRNSIYTGQLLNHIDDANVPIEDFFKRVRTSVYTLTNGKQTAWEHTSLIGNFSLNSGQLIHSVELPYKKEYIADKKFQSSGSAFDEVIVGLKTYNWYTQQAALVKLSQIDPKTLDDSSLFLLGRNILQTAIGGEFSANSIIKNLDTWLEKYSRDGKNLVLDGILFEIYFNSEGLFRETNFKGDLIDDIYKLQTNAKYKSSFEFISKQLSLFRDYLFYIPSTAPAPLAIEVQFKKEEYSVGESTRVAYGLTSIKHEGTELIVPTDGRVLNEIAVNHDQFLDTLRKQLCVPTELLRLSSNFPMKEIKEVHMPWNLKLARQK